MSTDFLPPVPMPAPTAPTVVAGWYPDPHGMGQRYWDGIQWSEHVAPVAPAAAAPTAEVADDFSAGGGYVVSVLIPLIGFIVGVVWLAKGRTSQGVRCMVLAVLSFCIWSALLASAGA